MAFKGTAGTSSSGASMSKYDVEVEGRLKALEKAVADEQEQKYRLLVENADLKKALRQTA